MQTHDPAPARALDSRSGGVKLLLEILKRTKVVGNSPAKGTIVQGATGATVGAGLGQVLPEQRVVDVTYSAVMRRGSAKHDQHEIESSKKGHLTTRGEICRTLTAAVEF
jgi:hypothetical protein